MSMNEAHSAYVQLDLCLLIMLDAANEGLEIELSAMEHIIRRGWVNPVYSANDDKRRDHRIIIGFVATRLGHRELAAFRAMRDAQ